MATNYVQEGCTVTLTAPDGGVTSGQGIIIGSIFGVCSFDAAAGAPVEVNREGVWDLPKATGAVSEGDEIYWSTSAANATTQGTGNYFIGAAVAAASQFAGTVRVCLNGIAIRSTGSP